MLAPVCVTVSAQDIILKKNADEIQAKVLKVTETEIEYKKMGKSRRPDLHHPGKRNIHHQISKRFQRYHFGQLRPHPIGYRRRLPEISGRNSSGIRTRRGQGLRIHQHGPDPLRNRTRHTHQPLSIHRSGPRVRLFLRIHRHGGLLRKRDRQLRRSRSIVFIHQSERILSGYQKNLLSIFRSTSVLHSE